MKHPNPLMLLRIAQADAYCMAFEYVSLLEQLPLIKRGAFVAPGFKSELLSFKAFKAHPLYRLKPGTYTDDTQMSIAIAEHLRDRVPNERDDFANSFVRTFIRDPRDGYSRGFQAILERVTTGQQLLLALDPSSDKNGAAMRSVPLGVLPNPITVCDVAARQARVTHDTEEGRVSSQIVALLSHFSLYSDKDLPGVVELALEVQPRFSEFLSAPWNGPVVCQKRQGDFGVGINTVAAVCTLLKEGQSLLDILHRVIEWGGDTDSVAAIAWGIASARMKEDIPAFFEDDLEPGGAFGPTFLRTLGTRLMDEYGKG